MSIIGIAHLQGALADAAAALRAVTVVVSRRGDRSGPAGQGSGIVWAEDGTIVTNAHVVPGRSRHDSSGVEVTLADGRRAPARVILRDSRRDLAVLVADRTVLGATPLPLPSLGEPSALRPGALLLALGHPLGMAHSLAVGIVHAAPDERSPYVQADLRLAPGNSGGPLADACGRIVGVNSMIVNGLGIAISIDAVRRLLADSESARRAA